MRFGGRHHCTLGEPLAKCNFFSHHNIRYVRSRLTILTVNLLKTISSSMGDSRDWSSGLTSFWYARLRPGRALIDLIISLERSMFWYIFWVLGLALRGAGLGVVLDYSNGVSKWLRHKRREHHPHHRGQPGRIRLRPAHTTTRSTLLSWRPCGTTPRCAVLGLAGAYLTLWRPQHFFVRAALAPSPTPI